ncbi:hypothetical protein RFI_02630, partial [Reticulomyxa filosa]
NRSFQRTEPIENEGPTLLDAKEQIELSFNTKHHVKEITEWSRSFQKRGSQKRVQIKSKSGNLSTMKAELLEKLSERMKTLRVAFQSRVEAILFSTPKLYKKLYKFTDDEINKILPLQKVFQLSIRELRIILKRYPYILKLDVQSQVVPRFKNTLFATYTTYSFFAYVYTYIKGLKELFPNQDITTIVIRSPVLLSQDVSVWMNRRDKVSNVLNVHPKILEMLIIRATGDIVQ